MDSPLSETMSTSAPTSSTGSNRKASSLCECSGHGRRQRRVLPGQANAASSLSSWSVSQAFRPVYPLPLCSRVTFSSTSEVLSPFSATCRPPDVLPSSLSSPSVNSTPLSPRVRSTDGSSASSAFCAPAPEQQRPPVNFAGSQSESPPLRDETRGTAAVLPSSSSSPSLPVASAFVRRVLAEQRRQERRQHRSLGQLYAHMYTSGERATPVSPALCFSGGPAGLVSTSRPQPERILSTPQARLADSSDFWDWGAVRRPSRRRTAGSNASFAFSGSTSDTPSCAASRLTSASTRAAPSSQVSPYLSTFRPRTFSPLCGLRLRPSQHLPLSREPESVRRASVVTTVRQNASPRSQHLIPDTVCSGTGSFDSGEDGRDQTVISRAGFAGAGGEAWENGSSAVPCVPSPASAKSETPDSEWLSSLHGHSEGTTWLSSPSGRYKERLQSRAISTAWATSRLRRLSAQDRMRVDGERDKSSRLEDRYLQKLCYGQRDSQGRLRGSEYSPVFVEAGGGVQTLERRPPGEVCTAPRQAEPTSSVETSLFGAQAIGGALLRFPRGYSWETVSQEVGGGLPPQSPTVKRLPAGESPFLLEPKHPLFSEGTAETRCRSAYPTSQKRSAGIVGSGYALRPWRETGSGGEPGDEDELGGEGGREGRGEKDAALGSRDRSKCGIDLPAALDGQVEEVTGALYVQQQERLLAPGFCRDFAVAEVVVSLQELVRIFGDEEWGEFSQVQTKLLSDRSAPKRSELFGPRPAPVCLGEGTKESLSSDMLVPDDEKRDEVTQLPSVISGQGGFGTSWNVSTVPPTSRTPDGTSAGCSQGSGYRRQPVVVRSVILGGEIGDAAGEASFQGETRGGDQHGSAGAIVAENGPGIPRVLQRVDRGVQVAGKVDKRARYTNANRTEQTLSQEQSMEGDRNEVPSGQDSTSKRTEKDARGGSAEHVRPAQQAQFLKGSGGEEREVDGSLPGQGETRKSRCRNASCESDDEHTRRGSATAGHQRAEKGDDESEAFSAELSEECFSVPPPAMTEREGWLSVPPPAMTERGGWLFAFNAGVLGDHSKLKQLVFSLNALKRLRAQRRGAQPWESQVGNICFSVVSSVGASGGTCTVPLEYCFRGQSNERPDSSVSRSQRKAVSKAALQRSQENAGWPAVWRLLSVSAQEALRRAIGRSKRLDTRVRQLVAQSLYYRRPRAKEAATLEWPSFSGSLSCDSARTTSSTSALATASSRAPSLSTAVPSALDAEGLSTADARVTRVRSKSTAVTAAPSAQTPPRTDIFLSSVRSISPFFFRPATEYSEQVDKKAMRPGLSQVVKRSRGREAHLEEASGEGPCDSFSWPSLFGGALADEGELKGYAITAQMLDMNSSEAATEFAEMQRERFIDPETLSLAVETEKELGEPIRASRLPDNLLDALISLFPGQTPRVECIDMLAAALNTMDWVASTPPPGALSGVNCSVPLRDGSRGFEPSAATRYRRPVVHCLDAVWLRGIGPFDWNSFELQPLMFRLVQDVESHFQRLWNRMTLLEDEENSRKDAPVVQKCRLLLPLYGPFLAYLIVFTLTRRHTGDRSASPEKQAFPNQPLPEECRVTFQVLDCVAPVAGESVGRVSVQRCASAADDLAVLLCRILWKRGSLRFLKQMPERGTLDEKVLMGVLPPTVALGATSQETSSKADILAQEAQMGEVAQFIGTEHLIRNRFTADCPGVVLMFSIEAFYSEHRTGLLTPSAVLGLRFLYARRLLEVFLLQKSCFHRNGLPALRG